MISIIRASLNKHLDNKLINELIEAYLETKRNYYLGGLRLSAVEGGRFCEAALRLLQQITTGAFDPLGKPLDSERIILRLASLSNESFSESIRLHIPRAVRMVYDIRNKRDAAHLADGIDPNTQDATLVVSVLNWILAEFIRIYHSVAATEAQKIVEDIVAKRVPVIQNFDGFLKVLNPKLTASNYCLVLLYQCGATGATMEELSHWVRPKMTRNLKRTLGELIDKKAFIHFDGQHYFITEAGIQFVEVEKMHNPF